MKTIKIFSLLLIILVIVFFNLDANAQCAMCQATVESNIDNGGSTGKGLNSGIMYLLAAPYIAMAAIGFLWYKKFKKKDVSINMKENKINLN